MNKFKFCHYISFCSLLLYYSTRAYIFSPVEGSCYVFPDTKQLLQGSRISWCSFAKFSLTIFQNVTLWCYLLYEKIVIIFSDKLMWNSYVYNILNSLLRKNRLLHSKCQRSGYFKCSSNKMQT